MPVLFVTGPDSTDKPGIVREMLAQLLSREKPVEITDIDDDDLDFIQESKAMMPIPDQDGRSGSNAIAWINSTIAITPRILFEHAHEQWTGIHQKFGDNIADFIESVQDLQPRIHRYLVLENCHDILCEYTKLTARSILQLSELVYCD